MPALLGAVFGAFAIMLGLFSLARGEEQSARSDTAADAAALAAAKQWHSEALMALTATAGTSAIAATVTAMSAFQPAAGLPQAMQFAGANGARVIGYSWPTDLSPTTWTVEVEVEQNDEVSTGDTAHRMRSTSRAKVEAIGALCNAGGVLGLTLNTGTCADPATLAIVCVPPTPATPNPRYVDCPQAPFIQAEFDTARTFVD